VDKTALEFFLIDRAGLLDPDILPIPYATAKGLWASDLLIQNNASWAIRIPPSLFPGFYVLRHEIIALHFARFSELGPQHYPQCLNLDISGDGTAQPPGTTALKFYQPGQEGLVYDTFQLEPSPYPIPGPTLWSGAVPNTQTEPVVWERESAIPAPR
jgi:lytic cellulose monooxygenase (C1-hydroxylating)